jgi:iron-sulfur cluster assembly protein
MATATQETQDLGIRNEQPQAPDAPALVVTPKAAREVNNIVHQQRLQCLTDLAPDLVEPFNALMKEGNRPPTLAEVGAKIGLSDKEVLIKLGAAAFAKPEQFTTEIRQAYQAHTAKAGKPPTSAELAANLGITEPELLQKLGASVSPVLGTVYLRLRVVGGGCSGFQPKLDLDPQVSDKDETFELHGVPVAVDRRSIMYLQGAIVDFHDDLNRRGFSVVNPSAKSTCGCGSSFSM